MKILIFETEHFETLFSDIQLWNINGNVIILAVSQKILTNINDFLQSHPINCEIIIHQLPENRFIHFLRLRSILRKEQIQLYFVNTISNHFFFHALLLSHSSKKKQILTIHDIHSFFLPPLHRTIKTRLNHWGKKKINSNNTVIFNILSDTLVDVLKHYTGDTHRIINLPGGIPDAQSFSDSGNSKILKIVIPGSIDSRRRDYETVEILVEQCNKVQLAVEFILLGAPYAQTDRQQLEKIMSKDVKGIVRIFEQPVAQTVFDSMIQACDLLWLPTRLYFSKDGIEETYGQSKSSGNIGDAIRFSKPILCPSELRIPTQLYSSYIPYTNINEIFPLLNKLIEHPEEMETLRKKAVQNTAFFSCEAIRKRYPDLFAI